jgi:transcription-repair coupling factor (superfamily II helicase)
MSTTEATGNALERTRELFRSLQGSPGFSEAVEQLQQGGRATFDGVHGSACALLAAALRPTCDGPLVVVCPGENDADAFCDDLEVFAAVEPWRFSAWETESEERTLHDDVFGDRLKTLKGLLRLEEAVPDEMTSAAGARPLIVTSIQSLLQHVPARSVLERTSRPLRVGMRLDADALVRWFVERGFHGTPAVRLPGEFSRRGGILDIFAPDWDRPVRVELFDDEIESIRCFDINSQRSLDPKQEIEVTVLDPTDSETACLTDYLTETSWFVLREPDQLTKEAEHFVSLLERPSEVHSLETVLREINRFAVATASNLASGQLGASCTLPVESVERFSGEIGRVRDELQRVGEQHEVFVVSANEAEVQRLTELFRDAELYESHRLHFPLGHLNRGFRFTPERSILVSANELFHRGEVRRTVRRRLGKAIDSFLDLKEGDLVVHLSHGIGRYRGIELLDKQGHVEEHLKIEFAGRAKVYVPATKIDLVQRYVGGTKSRPSLAKLGGSSWVRQKQAAQAAVMDMAADMLEMQAQRVARPGIAFAPDGEWQREFDSSFPYEETSDQLVAIEAIKADMLQPRPMDRLLCGDVGFGKTELAMRTAFKAVDSGYQVAVLVPTTILAEQHYHTFSERMSEFPFDIARLSRFCSSQEERQILEGLAHGQIDIVVGTHRLASRDLRFHNLGLVIIDEEQRFGVEVKERLKAFRSTVDALTMTATPIPRTLHMSLVGLRDISNLETPPEDRLNVETKVTRFNRELIRHAVLRELNRGGQIFFVHNRVQDIEVVANILRQTVPEARLEIGHGQMPEDKLEQVMVDFVAHRFDLLLATTIVENGLDIPNANTIFIDEADRYGLADLHQLRGRVGRYKHRAYCYLLVDPRKHVTPNAAKRLRAIEEYSDIGAGFALSMRDLEIRGAGNLLGVQQSGHIAAVGYELYCQLLEGAVNQLRNLPPRLSLDVDIDLPGAAYLPDDYIPDIRSKIDLYRRFRRAASYDELEGLSDELKDRFGMPPPPANRLLQLAELRLDAATWQITGICVEGDCLVLHYADRQRMEQLARRKRKLRVVDGRSCYLKIPDAIGDPEAILRLAKSVLRLH